jgi:caa(3)-type oxidase subunit IV
MAETQTHEVGHANEPTLKGYMVVAVALAIFTVTSFISNSLYRAEKITLMMSFAIILGGAVCKALLVAIYFMHLKFDWRLVYFMIIPCVILATMMIFVLLPDIVLAWHHS